MPVYSPFTWQDEVPASSPLRFRIRKADGTVIAEDATIELVTGITTAGTPVNAARMNAIEQGLAALETFSRDDMRAAACKVTGEGVSIHVTETKYLSWTVTNADDHFSVPAGDPTKLVVNKDGLAFIAYSLTAVTQPLHGPAWPHDLAIKVYKNGVVYASHSFTGQVDGGGTTTITPTLFTIPEILSAGDFFQVSGYLASVEYGTPYWNLSGVMQIIKL